MAREFKARAEADAAEARAREEERLEENKRQEAMQQSYCESLALVRSVLKIDEASVRPEQKIPDSMFHQPRRAPDPTAPMMMPSEPSLEARFAALDLSVDGTGDKPPGKALPKPKMLDKPLGHNWYPLTNTSWSVDALGDQ